MADNEVKIHVSADADLKGIDEAQRKVEEVHRGQSQAASEANRRPSTPARGDSLDRQIEELKKLRAEQKELEAQGAKSSANSVRRQADKLEKEIDREGARRLRVEDDDAKRAAKAAKEKAKEPIEQQREVISRGRAEEHEARLSGNTTAADAIKAETDILERALHLRKRYNLTQKESVDIARSEANARAAIGKQATEQTAQRKAGIGGAGGMARAVGMGEGVLAGGDLSGSTSSSLLQMGMRSGNPVVMAAASIAAIGTFVAGVRAREQDKDTMQGMELRENSAGRSRQRARNASVFGSSGSLISSALDAGEEIEARKAKQTSLDEKAREKWHDPSTWQWFGMRKNAGTRESEKNQAEIADLEKQKEKDIQAAQKKFMEEEGGIELSALRNRSKRTSEGNLGAMVDEMKGMWLSKYKESLQASGSESTAKEMADLTVQNELRDRQAQAGAGLVDARSGGAGIAAAALWSQGAVPGQDQVAAAIAGLHQTVVEGNNYTQIKDHSKK